MKARENDVIETGSLADFSFDDAETQDFFGIKGSSVKEPTAKVAKVIKEVKRDDKVVIDDENDESTTSLESEKSKGKKAEVKQKEEEEELDDSDFFQGEDGDKDEGKEGSKRKSNGEIKRSKKEDKSDDKNEDKDEGSDESKKTKSKKEIGGEEDDQDEEGDDEFYTKLATEMKERGTLANAEIPKNGKLTEDEFIDLQDTEIEARVQETFDSFFEELDDDGKKFLKFKKDGGRTADFMQTFIPALNIEEFDEANDAQVQAVLRYYLSNVERKDAEEVEDRIKWLKEGGKEKSYATKFFTAIRKDEEKAKKALLDAQEQAAKDKTEGAKQFNTELKEVLSKTEKIGAFPISRADQRDLEAYITKPTVKVGKNRYVPAFQATIAKIFGAETKAQKQRLILLAKLVRDDFDVSGVATEAKTEKVREARTTLGKSKLGIKANTSGSYTRKTLADYFPEDDKK